MAWETSAKQSTFRQAAAIQSATDSRQSIRSLVGLEKNASSSTRNIYSVVGLNVEAVDGMRQAIRDYVSRIESKLSEIDPNADASKAYRSDEVQAAVSKYVENVKTYCINLISTLNAFSDKLGDVKNSWVAVTQSMSENINATTSASDTTTKYQETIN